MILVFLWEGLGRDPHQVPSPLINQPLPKKLMSQKVFHGQVTLLNVFASWCDSCHAEHSVLIDIDNAGVVKMVGLVYKDNPQQVRQFLKRFGNPYQKIIVDENGQLGIDLGIYGIPETFLIDQNGIVRYKHIGPITPNVWTDVLLPKMKALQKVHHAK